jgi:hypothetical protein
MDVETSKQQNLIALWNAWKGKILITILTAVLGLSAVVNFAGIEVVDGLNGAICIQAAATDLPVIPSIVE